MTETEKWDYLTSLDDKHMRGAYILSEWAVFVVKQADLAFIHGAYLPAIITAVSAAETHLRSENGASGKISFQKLIDSSSINDALKNKLHKLRQYRNKWVHIENPWEDSQILNDENEIEQELELMATMAVEVLRETIYETPWV